MVCCCVAGLRLNIHLIMRRALKDRLCESGCFWYTWPGLNLRKVCIGYIEDVGDVNVSKQSCKLCCCLYLLLSVGVRDVHCQSALPKWSLVLLYVPVSLVLACSNTNCTIKAVLQVLRPHSVPCFVHHCSRCPEYQTPILLTAVLANFYSDT